jgi:hypothetical protein
MTDPRNDLPLHDQLADEYDELDWDVEREGRMREFADDEQPVTEPWEG